MEAENQRTIRKVQQEFAENSGFERRIIWDLLSSQQADLLRRKIRELIPDPQPDEGATNVYENRLRAIEERRKVLFESVWAQRKYTNLNSLTALIYILVTKETDFNLAPEAVEFSCHPVFRARKCFNANRDCESCCMIFIDEIGRVYHGWKDFIENNMLPEGTMVAPRRGIYMFDSNNKVELDIYTTPAASLAANILAAADTGSAIGGFVAAGVSIAALATTLPVSAPLLALSTGVGLVSAGYGALRSGGTIVDRAQHEQSISLTDRQARNSWIGVVAGAVGLGASGATRAMTAAAATGRNISLLTEVVVNGMNISSIVLSGTGVANGVLDLVLRYRDDERWSPLEIVQLSASLFLFTHSVCNFRLASKIVNETRNGTIEAYRRGLSNRQRRAFNKMAKETIRIQGETRGKMDIIRSVNEIPSKQYLTDIFKINRQLNERMIRPSFDGTGDIRLNGEIAVNAQELRASVQHGQGPDILGQVSNPIPQSYQNGTASSNPARPVLFAGAANINGNCNDELSPILAQFESASPLAAGVRALLQSSIFLPSGVQIRLSEFGQTLFERISNAESFENVVSIIGHTFADFPESIRFIMNLSRRFVENLLGNIENILRTYISSESVLYRIALHCINSYTERAVHFLIAMEDEIVETVREYFVSLNPNSDVTMQEVCKFCNNFFAISNL